MNYNQGRNEWETHPAFYIPASLPQPPYIPSRTIRMIPSKSEYYRLIIPLFPSLSFAWLTFRCLCFAYARLFICRFTSSPLSTPFAAHSSDVAPSDVCGALFVTSVLSDSRLRFCPMQTAFDIDKLCVVIARFYHSDRGEMALFVIATCNIHPAAFCRNQLYFEGILESSLSNIYT